MKQELTQKNLSIPGMHKKQGVKSVDISSGKSGKCHFGMVLRRDSGMEFSQIPI
jgi:hypothetical protein